MNAIIILAILFIALIIIIPLLEKSNWRMPEESQAKLSKWIWPMIGILLIVQLIMLI